MVLLYKHFDKTTTKINVDYKTEKVTIENFTNDPINLAFGIVKNPTFADYEELLEDRCFPRTRDMMKFHLRELGLDYYDPLQIIKKTKGKLNGDYFSLEVIEK